MNYYNDNDPFCCAWLRELITEGLIPEGEVDDRSIADVNPKDLEGFTQAHFFCGIGGWPYALRLAAVPADRPLWTGSCPCQAFSTAARGRNTTGDLWPEWRKLIKACRPKLVFGEQVASAVDWFDGICNDMEAMDYTMWAAVLPACCVGKDHARKRLYFVGNANDQGEPELQVDAKMAGVQDSGGFARTLLPPDGIPRKMAIMRGFGNAIVPQVAAEFIKCVSTLT